MVLFKRRAVQRALEELARDRTADQIADVLQEQGIRGWSTPSYCPIAMYLKKVTGVKALSVFPKDVRDGWKPIVMPISARLFVQEFDGGNYPTLEVHGTARYKIFHGVDL